MVPRISVIGRGRWPAQYHMLGLLSYEGAELAGIVDPNRNRLSAARDAFDVRALESLVELLVAVSINGVVRPPSALRIV
jgi:predicted dehydrogenase